MNTAITHTPTLAPSTIDWKQITEAACAKVPPLWPLESFVAVNPFMGLSGQDFASSADLMHRVTHGSILPAPSFYQGKLMEGGIADIDLETAVKLARSQAGEEWYGHLANVTPTHLKLWLHTSSQEDASRPVLHSVADAAEKMTRESWNLLVQEEVSKWCSTYYDERQSAWRMPWSSLPLYTAWKEAARRDRQPEILGLQDFRAMAKDLPNSANEALPVLLEELGVAEESVENYLHRLLMSISGWAGYVQFQVRENAQAGIKDDSLLQLVTIRLAYEVALLRNFDGPELREFWSAASDGQGAPISKDLAYHYVWQIATECGYQRLLIGAWKSPDFEEPVSQDTAKAVQAVFCIDVRSEVYRRCLESTSPGVETLGFAGFFAMPIEYLPVGHQGGSARCPVLLTPQHKVRERLSGLSPMEEEQELGALLDGRRIQHAWNAFKNSAISCFSFVETVGLSFGASLLRAVFARKPGSKKPETAPDIDGACKGGHHHGHDHDHSHGDQLDAATGIPPEEQVTLAAGALRHMGLQQDFGRIVLLCGHGSETTNNPYGSSLDCGACGGHAGDANARIAAYLLNQPHVRQALAETGVEIPESTWFMAGLHNTTTDEVTLFQKDQAPASHQKDIAKLEEWLAEAASKARLQRAPALNLGRGDKELLAEEITKRAADWSQVRPEWGLAGNAAFIAAPRERTKSLNLEGRAFLHNYRHQHDEGDATLELILTAPVIVASWINLQYYASTVNHTQYGSGNKVTHNVVGTVGVCQGNGGDLKVGLPFQSVHDGSKWVHEPLRLSVFIEAPREAISMILEKHEQVRELFDNGWLHLFAIEEDGDATHRYLPGQKWVPAK